ncbi:phage tail tube protein [Herbaspirillum sp. ST 5-3]|uniref:phage tail tube protein n=1 Tax=Oxalobacteraceae TaxID=75682 RepID=UPI0010A354F0|nr:phage tail tube protein [Herbaspirillum sp. ST 5-3]
MDQATGANSYIAIWEETNYGVRPGSPSLKKIAAAVAGVSLKANVEKLVSNALSSARNVAAARGGNITVSGSLPFELPLLGIGTLLKHAIGPVTTTNVKLVSDDGGLTNVIVKCADSGTPAGAGTLTLTGSSLTWAANGETAGAGVDVSAAGDYTLQSSTASHALTITTTGTVTGASAQVTVGAAAYKHVIKRGALPAGLGVEIAHTDIGVYEDFDGCRIDKMSLSVGTSGLVTGSFDVVGKQMTAPSGSALGVPTSVTHAPFVHHEAVILESGESVNAISFDIALMNALDPVRVVGSRNIATAREGRGDLTGKLTTLLEDATMINKVLNETASSNRLFFSTATGSVEFYMPSTKYFGDAGSGIPTDKGIVLGVDYQATNDAGLATDIQVTIINSEATL